MLLTHLLSYNAVSSIPFAFWQVALGAGHPRVKQHHTYHAYLVSQQTDLEKVMPRDPAYRILVPALLQRRVQIDKNIWLCDQQQQDAVLAAPDMMAVFYEIRQKMDWAPPLPAIGLHDPYSHHSKLSLPRG
jgi:hypothetical protein